MSIPLPQKRPAGTSGSMLRRENKKVKRPVNHHRSQPTSDVSLAAAEDSVHSSMSGGSDPRAFRVSALDMFSPRPTIRCSVGSQPYYTGTDTSPVSNKTKNSTARRKLSLSREDMDSKRSSRIDDLADELDAGALREILERDKRRRDKKRRAEEERARRRLERRAEKQRAAAAATGTRGTPPPEAHGAIGLGIQRDTSSPMEDVRPSTPQQRQLQTPAASPSTEDPVAVESPKIGRAHV